MHSTNAVHCSGYHSIMQLQTCVHGDARLLPAVCVLVLPCPLP